MEHRHREAAVFGVVDGLVVVLGLLMGTIAAHEPHLDVWHAALSGGLAEFVGMTAAKLKAEHMPWKSSLACGLMAGAACIIPAIPYFYSEDDWSVLVSVLTGLAVVGGITWLSKFRSWRTFGETVLVLLIAGALTYAGSFS